jgi:hypothetical protein
MIKLFILKLNPEQRITLHEPFRWRFCKEAIKKAGLGNGNGKYGMIRVRCLNMM